MFNIAELYFFGDGGLVVVVVLLLLLRPYHINNVHMV